MAIHALGDIAGQEVEPLAFDCFHVSVQTRHFNAVRSEPQAPTPGHEQPHRVDHAAARNTCSTCSPVMAS